MGKMKVLVFLVFTCLATGAAAQYESIRFPQTKEEIALMRDNNVMGETEWSMESGKKLPYYTRAFDPLGRQVITVDFYHRKYYAYDDSGNVTSYLDSFKKGEGFEVTEYKFKYYGHGLLRELTGPDIKSTFVYDPDKHQLVETMIKNDTAYKTRYTYDEKYRLTEAYFYGNDNERIAHIEKNYGPDERIFNDVLTKLTKNTIDSTLSVYEYNDKKKLDRIFRFRFQSYYYSATGSLKPDHSATHYENATFTYDLDDNGRKLAEEFTVKGDKLNYRYNTWQYDANGLVTKETKRFAKAEPATILHEYIYFPK